ncbi:MAG: hypothetical protein LBB38_03590, partial [Puniceicoccales bacterium]|nr:hypothetical protein [Puniceicoccales bacterium]
VDSEIYKAYALISRKRLSIGGEIPLTAAAKEVELDRVAKSTAIEVAGRLFAPTPGGAYQTRKGTKLANSAGHPIDGPEGLITELISNEQKLMKFVTCVRGLMEAAATDHCATARCKIYDMDCDSETISRALADAFDLAKPPAVNKPVDDECLKKLRNVIRYYHGIADARSSRAAAEKILELERRAGLHALYEDGYFDPDNGKFIFASLVSDALVSGLFTLFTAAGKGEHSMADYFLIYRPAKHGTDDIEAGIAEKPKFDEHLPAGSEAAESTRVDPPKDSEESSQLLIDNASKCECAPFAAGDFKIMLDCIADEVRYLFGHLTVSDFKEDPATSKPCNSSGYPYVDRFMGATYDAGLIFGTIASGHFQKCIGGTIVACDAANKRHHTLHGDIKADDVDRDTINEFILHMNEFRRDAYELLWNIEQFPPEAKAAYLKAIEDSKEKNTAELERWKKDQERNTRNILATELNLLHLYQPDAEP